MPNFHYYATFEESIAILRDVCAQGFRVIPEPAPRDEPAAESFDEVSDELVSMLKKAPAFYLAGSFTTFPIQFTHLKSGSAMGKYAINVLVAGPLMQCMVARVNAVEGKPTLLPGMVSHQKLYQNPDTGEWEKPPAEVVNAFRKVVSAIKKTCQPATDKSGIYIAPQALKLLEGDEASVG